MSAAAHPGLEFRHLRYLVAVADAGTFTHAAERMFVAQPTLSQQIRRLEEMVGTPLLQRRRDGCGLPRPAAFRLRSPAGLPERLAVDVASRLRSVATAAGAEVEWLEGPLDPEFSVIQQRRADACLGWLTSAPDALPACLDTMSLGEFEPETWLPASAGAASEDSIGLGELAGLTVIHGPRRSGAATYDAWLAALRDRRPKFAFTDLPVRHSLPMTLALAAAGRRAAVPTGPQHEVAARVPAQSASSYDMVQVGLDGHPLTATAVVAWHADLPRALQQVLFDTADTACSAIARRRD